METAPNADIRRYLLGGSSEDASTALEEAFFEDPALLARAQEVEHDLVDDYAAGRLDAEDRRRFEEHYLRSQVHVRRLGVAQALRASARGSGLLQAAAAPAPPRAPLPVTPRRPNIFDPRRSPLAWAAAAALVVLGVWASTRSAPQVPSTPQIVKAPSVSVPPVSPPPAAITVALMLTVGQTRDAGETPRLRIPPDAARVELGIPGPGREGLAADVRAVGGGGVWTGTVEAGASTARVLVPAQALPPGDYVLSIHRDAQVDGRFYFRILRHD